jgi:hypothetical protein
VRLDKTDTQTFYFRLIEESLYRKIFVRQNYSGVHSAGLTWRRSFPLLMYGFWPRTLPLDLSKLRGSLSISLPGAVPYPDHQWDGAKRIFRIPIGSRGIAGRLSYHLDLLWPNSIFDLEFGFNDDFWLVITFLRSGGTL